MSRKDQKGGRIALFMKNNIIGWACDLKDEYRSFKCCEFNFKTWSFHFKVIVVYRPPYSTIHPVTEAQVITE